MKKLIATILALMMMCAVLLPAGAEQMTGGWAVTEDSTVTEAAAEALNNAAQQQLGCTYEAVALLGTQVVAGTNYCLLCRVTPVVPDAQPHYAVVYVWQKLDGTAELLGTVDVEISLPDAAAE